MTNVIAFPSGNRRRTLNEDASPKEQYEAECLAGQRFPNSGDKALWERCREEWTLREWIELYKRFHVSTLKDARSLLCRLDKHFVPFLHLHPTGITRLTVIQWYQDLGHQFPQQANNCLATLKALFFKMSEWEVWSGANPCVKMKKYPKVRRARYVQPGDEMRRLLASLAYEPPDIQAYFLTCLFCGCRKSEAMKMKWDHLNLIDGIWYKPITKNGTDHAVPLPPVLIERFKTLPRLGPYVFDAPNELGHWKDTFTHAQWCRIRVRAHIQDVTIHDLRRTCASWLAINGNSTVIIAKALNHSNLQETATYARLDVGTLRTALTKQADLMLKSLEQVPTIQPIPAPPVEPAATATTPPPMDDRTEEWPG